MVVACLALGAFGALEARHVSVRHGMPIDWPSILISTMPRWISLAVLMPIVLAVGARVPLTPVRAWVVGMHLALFLAVSFVHASLDSWAMGYVAPAITVLFGLIPRLARSWYNTVPIVATTYAAVLFAAWGMTEARERQRRTLRASQLEAQLQTARLLRRCARSCSPTFSTTRSTASLLSSPTSSRGARSRPSNS